MSRQRILLLESDDPTRRFLCDLFGDEGFDVTVCGSLTQTLRLNTLMIAVKTALERD